MKKIDVHSISFRLWLMLTLFAASLILLIGGLTFYFVNNHYESMKSRETAEVASKIKSRYSSSGLDLMTLQDTIKEASSGNDLTILVRDSDNHPLTGRDGRMIDDSFRIGGYTDLENQIDKLNQKLKSTNFDSVTMTSTGDDGTKTLAYACVLQSGSDPDTAYYMYIFSPLYPVKSTLSIFRTMLIYVAVIAIVLAFIISMFLSRRIASPIRDITKGATEMGRGNYNVNFHGGTYTETRELAETLKMAEGEMDKAGQYQQDLIANVSHDLRTPLTMIRSYAEMIRDISGNDPVKREKHLDVIIEESNRLTKLVNDMLDLSRMQQQRMVLLKVPFDLREAVLACLSSFEVLEEQEGYHFKKNILRTPVFVNGDPDKIKQVITNLLSNATKYCGEDKVVIVSLRRSGRTVRFSVTDHGMGIAPEEIPHIWDKYYKSSTHHVRQTEGTGLGLSIVKEILNLHSAEFDVESTVGKGSTFWFELPVMKAPPRSSRKQIQAMAAAKESGPEPAPGSQNPADGQA